MNYAAAASALLAAFLDPHSRAAATRRSFSAYRPQSETSKAFYRARAEQKRQRRAARMNHLVSVGAISTVVPKAEVVPADKPKRKSRAKKVDA